MFPEALDDWWRTGSVGTKLLGYAGIAAWIAATVAWLLQRYFASEEPIHSLAYEMMEIAWLVMMMLG
jgi:hypothetical protein